MDIGKFAKREIALGQIETALELFSRQGDLFSIITLAGAAEEILGELRRHKEKRERAAILGSLMRILRPRSRHPEPEEVAWGESEDFVHLDPRHEAAFLLGRAIEEYIALTGTPTPAMLRFLAERTGAA